MSNQTLSPLPSSAPVDVVKGRIELRVIPSRLWYEDPGLASPCHTNWDSKNKYLSR